MIGWNDAHRSAAVLASEVHAELGIDLDEPVDVFQAIKDAGIVLAFAPLGNASGFYFGASQRKGVLLHSGHPRTRQRYTASHELGHHYFGHAAEVDGDLEVALGKDRSQWPPHEKEAEAFAAWFLMPRRLMRRGLAELGLKRAASPLDVYSLSLWLGTSYVATAYQLATTRLAEYGDVDSWARIPPRGLKIALAGELAPDDLRHDVWWLRDNSTTRRIEAREGDRIVVSLREIPSSGYVWLATQVPSQTVLLGELVSGSAPNLLDQFSDDTSSDLAGSEHLRTMVFEVGPDADSQAEKLVLLKVQPWDPLCVPTGMVEAAVAVHPRLYGVQLPPESFALSA